LGMAGGSAVAAAVVGCLSWHRCRPVARGSVSRSGRCWVHPGHRLSPTPRRRPVHAATLYSWMSPPSDRGVERHRRPRPEGGVSSSLVWRGEVERAVWCMRVVAAGEDAEHALEVAAVHDQEPVEAIGPTVRTKRSATVFAFGARTGVSTIALRSLKKSTASMLWACCPGRVARRALLATPQGRCPPGTGSSAPSSPHRQSEPADLARDPLIAQRGFSRAGRRTSSRISPLIGGRPLRLRYLQRCATSRPC
jgi:hypothetical protein